MENKIIKDKYIELNISNTFSYAHIIENKETDSVTTKLKAETWVKIQNAFNASTQSGDRDVAQLKNLYFNLKRKTRKDVAVERVSN